MHGRPPRLDPKSSPRMMLVTTASKLLPELYREAGAGRQFDSHGKEDPVRRIVPPVTLLLFLCAAAPSQSGREILPGTDPLRTEGDLSMQMQAGVDRMLDRLTAESVTSREKLWARDYLSADAYVRSVEPNRQRFRHYIGLADERIHPQDVSLVSTLRTPALVAETETLRVYDVRWPVLEGVDAEGLLLEPRRTVMAQVVALPDADSTPEQSVGLAGADPAAWQLPRRLAEGGCRVLVPTLITRDFKFSGNPRVHLSNQSHREFISRQAWFMGRHIIGFEVQKILSALDYFEKQDSPRRLPLGLAGYGEGALLAFYAAAADTRADAVLASGYFGRREEVWREPIYRNVWGLLQEFGDSGVASLIAPRTLIVEASRAPGVPGSPPPGNGVNDAAPGQIRTPSLESVRAEFGKAREHFARLKLEGRIRLAVSDNGTGLAGSSQAVEFLASALGIAPDLVPKSFPPLKDNRAGFDPERRQERQVRQLVDFCQKLMYLNPYPRAAFWKDADALSVERWRDSTRKYRDYFWKEIVGWLPPASQPAMPRTRLLYDQPRWRAYEVVLDIWPDVVAYGILLVPKDLEAGQKRPVVVAQHGLGGRPQDVCDPAKKDNIYHAFGAALADLGFVVFAPQNLYLGTESFRLLQRKANPLKLTFWAVMVRQHDQILRWLATLPFVDPGRIGFYGLSYGGKSAMFLPAILEGYALSICSGDFNETVWKHVSLEQSFSFILTNEYEHLEFDFGPRFNYAELAGLIAPRPFMVERGHADGVSLDEWVSYEYAKVRRLYAKLGLADRTGIEYFNGPHEINGREAFLFLQRHLGWNQGHEGMLR
jgi:dienelactone hydrolase